MSNYTVIAQNAFSIVIKYAIIYFLRTCWDLWEITAKLSCRDKKSQMQWSLASGKKERGKKNLSIVKRLAELIKCYTRWKYAIMEQNSALHCALILTLLPDRLYLWA